jgi:hypothetical protein
MKRAKVFVLHNPPRGLILINAATIPYRDWKRDDADEGIILQLLIPKTPRPNPPTATVPYPDWKRDEAGEGTPPRS